MSDYKIFNPEVEKPLHELSRKEAKEHFRLFNSKIEERLNELSKLISNHGIKLDYTRVSLFRLGEWLDKNIIENSKIKGEPSSYTFSICNDISMYLSESIIRKSAKTKWVLNTIKESDISYHRPVLMGFNVRNKNYNIDFDLLLCQYAFRILEGNSFETELLVDMYDSAISKCWTK
jgi:hypothetical protein